MYMCKQQLLLSKISVKCHCDFPCKPKHACTCLLVLASRNKRKRLFGLNCNCTHPRKEQIRAPFYPEDLLTPRLNNGKSYTIADTPHNSRHLVSSSAAFGRRAGSGCSSVSSRETDAADTEGAHLASSRRRPPRTMER